MIEIKNVNKAFDDIVALKDVSLVIKESQIFGLIGSNGAGKSTILKILAGIIRPDNGTVQVDGVAVYENHYF